MQLDNFNIVFSSIWIEEMECCPSTLIGTQTLNLQSIDLFFKYLSNVKPILFWLPCRNFEFVFDHHKHPIELKKNWNKWNVNTNMHAFKYNFRTHIFSADYGSGRTNVLGPCLFLSGLLTCLSRLILSPVRHQSSSGLLIFKPTDTGVNLSSGSSSKLDKL